MRFKFQEINLVSSETVIGQQSTILSAKNLRSLTLSNIAISKNICRELRRKLCSASLLLCLFIKLYLARSVNIQYRAVNEHANEYKLQR